MNGLATGLAGLATSEAMAGGSASATAVGEGSRRKHSADAATGVQLSRAILGYVMFVVAIITLAPFRFADAPAHGFTLIWTPQDIVMNVVMFVPLGFLYGLTRPAGAPARLAAALLLGVAASAFVELAQLFEAERFSSPIDIATNTAGMVAGLLLHRVVSRRVNAARAVHSLALQLPLMGLVYLLVPMLWLAGLAGSAGVRPWLVLLPAVFAGGILGSVHAGYLAPEPKPGTVAQESATLLWLAMAACAWSIVALLPSGLRDPSVMLAAIAVTVGVAMLRSIATSRARAARHLVTRRFELPTLRLVLPCFAAYLALSSLWPLDGGGAPWHVGIALLRDGVATTQRHVYLALEHVAAFTLTGYVIAELHGRERLPYRAMLPRVLRWSTGIALLLEAARGFHADYGASLLLLTFSIAASLFGGWLYHLQRDHVLELLASRANAPV